MLRQYEDKHNEIRKLRKDNQEETIEKCKEYIEILKHIWNEDISDDMWFSHHNMARSQKIIGQIDNAYENTYKALGYIDVENMFDYRPAYSIWELAECKAVEGKIKESVNLYIDCIKRLRKIKDEVLKFYCVYNIAKVTKKTNYMRKLIAYYETHMLQETIKTHGEFDGALLEMYKDLINIYIEKGITEKAIQFINQIKHKGTRIKLRKLILA